MSESFPPGGEVLPPSLGRRIDQACDHFEAAWRAGAAPRIENALDGWAGTERLALAQELILLDLYYRRCSGAAPLAEDYLDRFPSLDRTWLADVIAAEATPSGVNVSPITTILPSSAEVTQNCRGAYDFLAPPLNPGDLGRLGPYDVLKVIGAGGMGVVFQAYDPQLERWVALKAMLPGLGVSASARQRFLREAKATAAIKHDHIITIYQVGEDRGVPFLAMEYLEGEPLNALLRREPGGQGAFPLPLRETLRICREIAEGLDAAHQRGLIHRDVKPANIWLEGDRRRVKILDFGLALAASDDANGPEENAIVGTPAYMAPEQVAGRPVDGRADLFSLGCIFYRMATGEPPFQGNGAISTFVSVTTEAPTCPRELNASLPAAVRELLVQLLAKQREDRPASARAVVAALQAIEKRLTVSHGDKDGSVRLTRRRIWPWLAAAILLALMIWRFGPTATRYGADTRGLVVETNAPAVGEQTFDSAETANWRFDDTRYDQMSEEAAEKALRMLLEEEAAPNADTDQLRIAVAEFRRKQAGTPQALTAAKLLQRLPSPLDALNRERISPYELAAAGGGDPLATPQELTAIFGDSRLHHAHWADVVVIHPAGKQVFSGSHDGTVKVWRMSSGEAQGTMHWGTVAFPALSPDGRTLAVCGDRPEVQLWDLKTGKQDLTLRGHADGFINAATFSHDGKTLATASSDGSVKLWDPAAGAVRQTLRGRKDWFQTLVFSPDDKSLTGTFRDIHTVLTWDVAGGDPRAQTTEGYVAAISPDGKQWAIRYDDAFWVKIVEASTGKQVRVLNELTRSTRCAAFSPDGRRLATGGRSAELKLWDLNTGKVVHDLQSYSYECSILSVAFSADGSMLASAGDDGRVRLWDMKTGKEIVPLKATYEMHAAVGRDGRTLATSDGNQIRILDMTTGTESQKLVGTDFTGQLALTPDGRSLLALNWYGPIDLWNLATSQPQRLSDHAGAFPHALAITPDGTLAASGDGMTTQIKLWDLAAKRQLRTLNHVGFSSSLDFSPDGRLLAAATRGNVVKVWSVADGGQQCVLIGGQVAFCPDGSLAVAVDDGITLYDAVSWKAFRTLHRKTTDPSEPISLVVSPSGRLLATANTDGRIAVWDLSDEKAEPRSFWLHHSRQIEAHLAFTPESRYLISANANGTVYVLRLTPAPGW